MIPLAHLQEWTAHAPWPDLRQVEQDLIISRALCDLFSNSQLQGKIAFRGGTAIHKLLFDTPLRYSEDIDLVQTIAEPIGGIIDGVRHSLSWLGKCRRFQTHSVMHLIFSFLPETGGGQPHKLKIEINTREHDCLHGLKTYPFMVSSDWYNAAVEIVSFEPEELLGTKLRALLQRNKNRDLFDLNEALQRSDLVFERILDCFQYYLSRENNLISRANAEERMLGKLNRSLSEDVSPLLPTGVSFTEDNAIAAFGRVWKELINRLPGEPWSSSKPVIDAIRKSKFPNFLNGVYQ